MKLSKDYKEWWSSTARNKGRVLHPHWPSSSIVAHSARKAEASLEVKRQRAVFNAIREKARSDWSLDLEDFRLITREFFHRLQYDTQKQFVILAGFVAPAMAKKCKVEPT